ncbi:glycerol-3-phosphate acyltransferase [Oceanotoga teriensis]|uniref:glycerol-3-phosphate acyltransferase n=1 Tax=Oceanotoga teriensis TaxID=515440 RepID=UPI0027132C08|nr:glycerol-3-phosphate acyltransferase [Oceanotoga teriensis]MDO7976337.1 glycerol-3-phosphate acyltransferase [Oceanotoga teriensis]
MNILILILSYLIGSIPFSYILPKVFKNKNTLKEGTKNPGGTNAIYTSGYFIGILSMVLDVFKGIIVFLIADYFLESLFFINLALILAVLGHNWSLFLKFKGGKGIAVNWGIIFADSVIMGITFLILSTFYTLLTKYLSIGVLLSILSIIVLKIFMGSNEYLFAYIVIYGVNLFKHRINFIRISQGKEVKIFQGLKEAGN